MKAHPMLVEQMRPVEARYPRSSIEMLRSGSHLVTVPGVRLLSGWTAYAVARKATAHTVEDARVADDPHVCTMLLWLPPGFPGASPRHFWTLEAIRGRHQWEHPGQSSESNPIPGYAGPVGTWFAWSPQTWNPNSDGILRWLNTARMRFQVGFAGRAGERAVQ